MTGKAAPALLLAAGTVGLLGLPFWASPYWTRIATGVLMWAGLACSWNVVGGYAGYINFGHAAFFGIGAYATAIFMGDDHRWPFAATLPVGMAIAAVLAAVIGAPTLRLRGAYFAIATWAFAEVLFELATILEVTGGTGGLSLPPLLDERFFYYTMLGAAAATYGLAWVLLERARFGYRLRALRDHEVAAETMGIDTTRVKVEAFALSAALAAVFGSIYAYWVTFIDPPSALGGDLTDQMVVMVLLGGLGHLWGPALGAAALYLVNRFFWATWGDTAAYIALLGIVIAAVVLVLPDGLVSLWPRVRRLGALRAVLGKLR